MIEKYKSNAGNAIKGTAITLAFGLVFIMATYAVAENGVPDVNVNSWQNYTVQTGDTLWQIAHDIAGEKPDTREFVEFICDKNGIDNPRLLNSGQQISVPDKFDYKSLHNPIETFTYYIDRGTK